MLHAITPTSPARRASPRHGSCATAPLPSFSPHSYIASPACTPAFLSSWPTPACARTSSSLLASLSHLGQDQARVYPLRLKLSSPPPAATHTPLTHLPTPLLPRTLATALHTPPRTTHALPPACLFSGFLVALGHVAASTHGVFGLGFHIDKHFRHTCSILQTHNFQRSKSKTCAKLR